MKDYYLTIARHLRGAACLLFLVFLMTACSKDDTELSVPVPPVAKGFVLTKESVLAEPEASLIEVEVVADDEITWTVDQPLQEWLTAKNSTNKGSGVITLELDVNMERLSRQGYILIRCNNKKFYINVQQKEGINVAPNQPEYLFPEANAVAVDPYPVFGWKIAEDPNKDNVTYTLSYSKNQADWTTTQPINKLTYNEELNTFDRLTHYTSTKLDENTTYYWYVTAIDPDGLQTKGEVRSFTTGSITIPADGSWTIYGGSESGEIPLVFTGDGFIPSDYVKGGAFDKKIDQGIEYFFNCEPYKSYRKHFKVIKLVAYSNERGTTVHDKDATFPHVVDVDTRFKVQFNGNGYNNTQMTFGNSDNGGNDNNIGAAYDFVKKNIPEIDGKTLVRTTVVVVANYWLYGGTCWWTYSDENGNSDWTGNGYTGHDGMAITIVPACEQGKNIPWMDQSRNHHVYYSYEATMHHEAGGHGFGRLADEYKYGYYPAGAWEIGNINIGSQHGYNGNIDVTNDPARVKWKAFFSTADIRARYPQVGIYEGAQYTKNVYMSENTESCMNNMSTPQSAVSREYIVQKIYKALGEEYSFEKFMEKDKADPTFRKTRSSKNHSQQGIHHTPPQVIKLK